MNGFRAFLLAAGVLGTAPALAAPVTVSIEPLGAAPYSLAGNTGDEIVPVGYGNSGPVTFDWNPLNQNGQVLRYWRGEYSSANRDAAFCSLGQTLTCYIDIEVAPGNTLTLESFLLVTYLGDSYQMDYTVFDLADNSPVATGTPTVGGAGLTINVGASSGTGFRIGFGPDGYNGGINDIVYSVARDTTTAVPAPPALALFGVGLLGLGLVRRRQQAG